MDGNCFNCHAHVKSGEAHKCPKKLRDLTPEDKEMVIQYIKEKYNRPEPTQEGE